MRRLKKKQDLNLLHLPRTHIPFKIKVPPPTPTELVDEQGQGLPVGGADVEQQSRTPIGPEAQGHVLGPRRGVGGDGGRPAAGVPARLVRPLEGVADGGPRCEAGRHLWRKER